MTLADWKDQAACVGTPIWWWYAPEGESDEAVIPEATALCAACPVRKHCLEHAIANETDGMWGGCTPDEIAKRRRRAGVRLHRFNPDKVPTIVGVAELPPPTPFPDPKNERSNDELWTERARRRNELADSSPPLFGSGAVTTNGWGARRVNKARRTIEETDDGS